jgi:tryptophan synthase alpha chain
VLLITPQTSDERIARQRFKRFYLYGSSASVTGSQSGFGSTQEAYFKRMPTWT